MPQHDLETGICCLSEQHGCCSPSLWRSATNRDLENGENLFSKYSSFLEFCVYVNSMLSRDPGPRCSLNGFGHEFGFRRTSLAAAGCNRLLDATGCFTATPESHCKARSTWAPNDCLVSNSSSKFADSSMRRSNLPRLSSTILHIPRVYSSILGLTQHFACILALLYYHVNPQADSPTVSKPPDTGKARRPSIGITAITC